MNWKRNFLRGTIVLIIAYVVVLILNAAAKQLLISKGLLPANGEVSKTLYGTELNCYTGGLDNAPNYTMRGYNDSLVPGNDMVADQYGFLHGDTAPLAQVKPEGTIRIVLAGGSGMRGNLQTWGVVKMFDYPEGMYDYETSIAGKLKKILEAKYPKTRFEVINTAVVMRQFNQSLASYLEKVQDLHPDIIVTMDGYNDDRLSMEFEKRGDPYKTTLGHSEQGIDLEILNRASRFGYAWMYLSYVAMHGPVQEHGGMSLWEIVKYVIGRITWSDVKYITHHPDVVLPHKVVNPKDFLPIQPYMEKNLEKQMRLYATYERILQGDSVFSVVCYQPILDRGGMQKQLSDKEKKIKAFLNYQEPESMSYDSVLMKISGNYPQDLQNAFNKLGSERAYLKTYHYDYFINAYISPTIDSIVRSHGGVYIDLGEKMTRLGPDVEFYMDYTHTTPFGNQFIAEQIAEPIATHLGNKLVE
jgi:hypothetical protein